MIHGTAQESAHTALLVVGSTKRLFGQDGFQNGTRWDPE